MTLPEQAADIRAKLQAAAARVKFNDKVHRYWLDGKPAPGVTTICKQWHREALQRWMIHEQARGTARACVQFPIHEGVESVDEYADRMLGEAKLLLEGERLAKQAADVGNELHSLVEWWCRAQIDEATERPVGGDQGEALFEQWLAWALDAGLVVVAVEQLLFGAIGNRRYCGRADLIAFVQEQLEILDWKSREYAGRLWPDQRMQNVAYRNAAAQALECPMPGGRIVVVPRDGSPAKPIPVDGDPLADLDAFSACLQLYYWSKQ